MRTLITLPTEHGDLVFSYFEHCGQQGLVVSNGKYDETPFLRIHSSCVFSESFRALDCDCARQLDAALQHIREFGGLVIYLYQEGRGLGLAGKVEAIALEQAHGMNTAEAFTALGHKPDLRNYDAAIAILRELGIKKVVLGTNNPEKTKQLIEAGIEVIDRLVLPIKSNELMKKYLVNKTKALGHHEEG